MRVRIGKYFLKIDVNKIIPNVLGVASITQDGYHVPFFDFDNTTLKRIKVEARRMIEDYFLSDFHVFTSSKNNYHAITLDKVTKGMIVDLHDQIKDYDVQHDVHSMKRGYWVLRISPKTSPIKYVTTIKSPYNHYVKSNAHKNYLKKFFSIKTSGESAYDNFTKIRFDKYSTIQKKL